MLKELNNLFFSLLDSDVVIGSSADLEGTAPPQPTTAEHNPSQATPAQLEVTMEAEILPEDDISPEAQNINATAAPGDMPQATSMAPNPTVASVSTGPTQGSSTVLENSQVTSTPASSTPEPTAVPEATTPNPDTIINEEHASTAPPPQEQDDVTTHIPAPTDAAQEDTLDDITPGVTNGDSVNVTPDATKATSNPQEKPRPYKPPPAKPVLTKPNSKPEVKPMGPAQAANIDDPRDYQAGKKKAPIIRTDSQPLETNDLE